MSWAQLWLMVGVLHSPVDTTARNGLHLTLDSCLKIADRNATAIQLAAAGVQLSGADVLRRYGAFFPGATVGAGYLRQDGNTFLSQTATVPTSATFSILGYHLAVSFNLFNGFRDKAGLEGALQAQDAALFNLARARQQVGYDVTQAFLQAILDRELVGIARQNLGLSEAREAQLVDLVRVGRRPPPDLFRQQAQTSADRATVVDAVNRQHDDEIALLQRLRLAPDSIVDLVAPADDTLPLVGASDSVGRLIATARAERPDLRAAAATSREAEAGLRVAQGGRLPRIDLGLDVFGAGRVFDHEVQNGTNLLPPTQRALLSQVVPQSAYSLSLGLSWNVFDHNLTRFDIDRATVALQTSQLLYDDLNLRIASEVQQAMGDYSAAVERLTAAQSGVVFADTAFAAIQARYDIGLSPFVDVVTAQAALAQARAAHAAAVIRFALSKRILTLAVGGEMPVR